LVRASGSGTTGRGPGSTTLWAGIVEEASRIIEAFAGGWYGKNVPFRQAMSEGRAENYPFTKTTVLMSQIGCTDDEALRKCVQRSRNKLRRLATSAGDPLPTIDAKKFYEVQKYIVLTGHITESLVTIVAGGTWSKLSDADKKIFSEVLWEASSRATTEIFDAESKLAADFEKRGKTVVRVDRGPFIKAVQSAVTAPDAPWPKELYDRVQAIK